jgi:signal transduction histidine kinase
MYTCVLAVGASDDALRALRDAAKELGEISVDAAPDADAARDRLAQAPNEVHAVLVGPVENAPRVAETSLALDGRRAVHVLGPLTTVEAARALLGTIQAEAQARGERQETLLSMIAHDVRAPLGVAQGALAELGHPTVGALGEEQTRLVRLARRSLDRLAKLSVNVSQLARIETGRLVLAPSRCDLGALARDVAQRIEREETTGPVQLAVDAAPAPCNVDADKVRIAIDNLLSNALRFGQAQVLVRAFTEGAGDDARAVLVVEDDGPGLPAGLGDPFDRVKAASMRAGKTGSGLGLAVVRGIARAHGGEATGETIATDGARPRGARFTLSFFVARALP